MNALGTFKISKTYLGMTKDLGKAVKDTYEKKQETICQSLWGKCEWAFGLGVVYCIAGAICIVFQILLAALGFFFYYHVLVSYHLTSITYESMALGKNKYDKYAYLNQKASDKWMDTSLRYLQFDMLDQHTTVRRDLQERHFSMEVNINTYTKCATNHILYETTEAIAAAHQITNDTPSPSPNCIEVLNLPSSSRRRLAESDEDEGVNVATITLPEGYGGVRGELYDIETKEDGFILTMNNMMNTVNSIAKKLDMDVVEPKKNKRRRPRNPNMPSNPKLKKRKELKRRKTLFSSVISLLLRE